MMIPIVLAMLAVAPSAAPKVSASAGLDHILQLLVRKDDPSRSCTRDGRWCVRLIAGEKGPRPAVSANGIVRTASRPANEPHEFAVWPYLYGLENGRFLAGVTEQLTTAYSGGGGSVTTLRLYAISRDGETGVRPVMEHPIQASLMIRACFSRGDEKKRHGACHDEYSYSARIGLTPGRHAAMPILTYTSEAWSFPRGVRRSQDSTQMRALRPADLTRQRDLVCSFTRRLRFDQEWGIYRSETEMPDCGDYTTP